MKHTTNTPQETWAPIPGFPAYRVSSRGRIQSRWAMGNARLAGDLAETWRTLSPAVDDNGYRGLTLVAPDGRHVKRRVHRLVCEAFHGAAPEGHCVRHLNSDRTDNRAANLTWGTYRDNEGDKHRAGTWETRRVGKLSTAQRAEIRARRGEPRAALAREFGVHVSTVTRILNKTTWGNDG